LPKDNPDSRSISKEHVFDRAAFKECHAATIVEVEEGEFMVAFFAGTREGEEDVAIWATKSERGLWSVPKRVAWDEGAPCWNPVLFKGGGGLLHLFYKVGFSPGTWTGVQLTSDDCGVSWSDPSYLPAGLLGPTKNKPITMSNGEVICGSSVESYRAWTCWAEVIGESDWRRFGPVCCEGVPKGVIQPSIVELSEGHLRMFMRSAPSVARICVAESHDYGRTWTKATPTDLPNPNSGIDALRLPSGRILIVYNDSSTLRTPLSMAASNDGGRTWKKLLDLETDAGEFSYPSVIQSSSGESTSYTPGNERGSGMPLSRTSGSLRFSLDDLGRLLRARIGVSLPRSVP